jgi:hypothetical protein
MKKCGLQGQGPLFPVINDTAATSKIYGGPYVALDLKPTKNEGKGRKGGNKNNVIVDWYSPQFGKKKQSLDEDQVSNIAKEVFQSSPIVEVNNCSWYTFRKSLPRLAGRCWCTDLDAHKAGMWSKKSNCTNLYHDFGVEDMAVYKNNPAADPLFQMMCFTVKKRK